MTKFSGIVAPKPILICAVLVLLLTSACVESENRPVGASENGTLEAIGNSSTVPLESSKLPENDREWRAILCANLHNTSGLSTDFCAVQNSPIMTGQRFDPVRLIQSVNYFATVGRERCTKAIREYAQTCREASPEEITALGLNEDRVIVLGLALYESADVKAASREYIVRNSPPRIWVVGTTWMRHQDIDAEQWPLFPFSTIADLPFLLGTGSHWGSVSRDAYSWFESYEPGKRFRNKILHPSACPNEVAEKLRERAAENWLLGGFTDTKTLDQFANNISVQVDQCLAGLGARKIQQDGLRCVWSKPLQRFVLEE